MQDEDADYDIPQPVSEIEANTEDPAGAEDTLEDELGIAEIDLAPNDDDAVPETDEYVA